jgi:hypothetical protein
MVRVGGAAAVALLPDAVTPWLLVRGQGAAGAAIQGAGAGAEAEEKSWVVVG